MVHCAPAFGEDDYRVCLANGVISKVVALALNKMLYSLFIYVSRDGYASRFSNNCLLFMI